MRRFVIPAVVAALVAVCSVAAQTATLVASATALAPGGGQVVFTFNAAFPGNPALFALEVASPPDWTYVSGTGEPAIRPAVGTRAALGSPLAWLDLARRSSPLQFSFVLAYPAGASAASIASALTLRQIIQVTVTDKTTGQTTIENREVRTDLAPATLAFGVAPVITTQPINVTATIGASASFSVSATGTAPLAYRWFKNGTVITGATGPALNVPDVQPITEGIYSVMVSNPFGSVNSANVTLVASVPGSGGGGGIGGGGGGGGGFPPGGGGATPPTAPVITTAPASQAVRSGETAIFQVSAGGTAPLGYQWRKNGTVLAGATGSMLALANAQAVDAGSYTVEVSNAAGSVTSPAATLTITAPPVEPLAVPPVIVAQSPRATVIEGAALSLGVTATGTAPLTYQWRRNGELVAGASTATLALASIRLADAGEYSAVVANRVGAVASAAIRVEVTPAAAAPSLLAPPQSLSALAGANVTFTVIAGGTPPFSYQWRKEGSALAGATAATLALNGIQASDAGSYSVVVSNAVGSVASPGAALALASVGVPPLITTPPAPQAGVPGGAATFSVGVAGTAPFAYQWRRNGVALPGATAASLALPNLRSADAGSYTVAVTNAAGTVSSGPAALTIAAPPGPPAILVEPVDVVVGAGGRAVFRVTAGGAAPLSYEWRRNGATVAGGSTLALTNVQASDAGLYSVVVANAAGSVTSRAATLTLRGRSYAGSYFGAFGSGGSFALIVRDDHTGVFLGFATGTRTAMISRNVTVDDSGRFRVVTTTSETAAAASRGATLPRAEAAGSEIAIEAVIGADGTLAGTVAGLNTSVSATRAAAGATQAVAGFYQAGAVGSSAASDLIVGPAGQAFVLTTTPAGSDGGLGTVDGSGRIALTTAGNATLTGNLAAASATLTASLTAAGGAKFEFAGGSDARPTTEKLANIATRGLVGGNAGALIAGFVVTGDGPKEVLIRAIGPTLAAFGVGDALAAARLELFNGQASVATSTAWGQAANRGEIVAAAARAGAFALDPTSRDAVLLLTLEPGAYTAVVAGEGDLAGVALVEVYDVAQGATPAQKVVNIASRALAGSGERTLTAGFVISGDVPKRVLIRGVGPGLTAFGVSGALGDPQLTLFKAGASVAVNDNWASGADAPVIAAAAASVGAFAFAPASLDAALYLHLEPGPYTVQLSGAGNAPGTALIEVYEVP